MSIETADQFEALLKIGRIVGLTLNYMRDYVRPGITTAELDDLADGFLQQYGARSAPRITYNYPGCTCISINDEAAHGIPGERAVRPGDLVKLDVSAELNGYFADAAITVGVPPLTPQKQRLLDCARATMDAAIAAAKALLPLNHIGKTAETFARRHGYKVIQDLPGHGVGKALHESPSVPNHYLPQIKGQLHAGLVITIEPHITAGKNRTRTDANGWTLKTIDGQPAANFEHTIIVMPDKPLLVTAV
jgi:methionyl aminopeptidase